MYRPRLRILVLSEFFPSPATPALGSFVERQVDHLQPHCDQVVVVPTRVFPHLRIWRQIGRPQRVWAELRAWRAALRRIPLQADHKGIPVHYPRYTSQPKQLLHGLWGMFAYLFLRGKLRALHAEQPFDLIHAHYASPCGVIALLAQRWMGVPIALSVHGADITYTVRQDPLGAAIVRWVFRHVDVIFVNSRWTARESVRYGAPPDRVHVVYLGGDAPARALPTPPHRDAVTLLSVGYLEERKGHEFVLRAMQRLVDQGYQLRYVIVGSGLQEPRLRALTAELGLSALVSFEGYQAHDDVWPYFADCDIFVLPSWNEAFGVVYVEALGMGKPAIGCAGEGGPEDIKALADCIELVQPRDVESLVGALKRLLDDPVRRQRMGEAGRSLAADHFTWRRNAADTLRFYEQIREAHSVHAEGRAPL